MPLPLKLQATKTDAANFCREKASKKVTLLKILNNKQRIYICNYPYGNQHFELTIHSTNCRTSKAAIAIIYLPLSPYNEGLTVAFKYKYINFLIYFILT